MHDRCDYTERSAKCCMLTPHPLSMDPSQSSVSDDDEPLDETLIERLSALKDIVPPTTRSAISSTVSTLTSVVTGAGILAGRAAWVVTTSALLVGLPFALAVEDEARVAQQEREFNAQQGGAAAMLGGAAPGSPGATPGAPGTPGAPAGFPGAAHQNQDQGLRPPGF